MRPDGDERHAAHDKCQKQLLGRFSSREKTEPREPPHAPDNNGRHVKLPPDFDKALIAPFALGVARGEDHLEDNRSADQNEKEHATPNRHGTRHHERHQTGYENMHRARNEVALQQHAERVAVQS